jgi:N-acetylmuramoyl-L-alanine amidase CwlA
MKYTVDHIPRTTPYDRRPGIPMTPTTITIHNTGNPSSTARNERNWLTNPSNDRQASFHIVIDEKEAIECLPLNEVAWHAGDGRRVGGGNMASISIEICESGNYEQTLENAANLVAKLLRERGWGVDRLRRHYDWSGKICPRLMYDGGSWAGWERFKQMVAERLKPQEEKPKEEGEDKLELSDWMWNELVKELEQLQKDEVIADKQWVEKAKKKQLTVSELTWLNTIVARRLAIKKGAIV